MEEEKIKELIRKTAFACSTDSARPLFTGVLCEIKDNKIRVKESDCPHQDCVHTGFVGETNRPIICAYNAVYIVIEGNSDYDASIG